MSSPSFFADNIHTRMWRSLEEVWGESGASGAGARYTGSEGAIKGAMSIQPRSQDLFPGPSQGKGPGNEVDEHQITGASQEHHRSITKA